MKTDDKLTPKMELFCVEFLRDRNATRAAKAAGYSARTARQQGARLLSNVAVRARVDAHTAAIRTEVKVEKAELVEALLRILRFDPRKFYDANGNRIPMQDLPEEIALALDGIKVFEEYEREGKHRYKIGEVRELSWTKRIEAVKLLGIELGMFKEQTKVDVTINLADGLKRARERVKASKAQP